MNAIVGIFPALIALWFVYQAGKRVESMSKAHREFAETAYEIYKEQNETIDILIKKRNDLVMKLTPEERMKWLYSKDSLYP